MDPKTTRCTTCEAEFTDAELKDAFACPSCGSEGIPCSIAQDVTVKINWHELRILTIWANFHAQAHCDPGSQKSLATIIQRLETQRPDGFPALSILGELRAFQDAGCDVTYHGPGGEVVNLPKTVKN